MNRHDFLAALAATGLGIAGPLRAAPPADRVRRVGILALGVDDATSRVFVAAFRERLQQLGWRAGSDLEVDVRWAGNDPRKAAAELLQVLPEAVVVQGAAGIDAMRLETRTVPTVFVQVTDPVAAGYIASLERPGGHITGVANFPASIAGDRVRALKDIAPQLNRAVLVHDRHYPTPKPLLRAAETAAIALGLEVQATGAGDADELERLLREAAREANAGLVVFPSPFTVMQTERIVGLAAQLRLPAVYPLPSFAASGGLLAYGIDTPAMWHESAVLVDRILRGCGSRRPAGARAEPRLHRRQREDGEGARPQLAAGAPGAGSSGHRVGRSSRRGLDTALTPLAAPEGEPER